MWSAADSEITVRVEKSNKLSTLSTAACKQNRINITWKAVKQHNCDSVNIDYTFLLSLFSYWELLKSFEQHFIRFT